MSLQPSQLPHQAVIVGAANSGARCHDEVRQPALCWRRARFVMVAGVAVCKPSQRPAARRSRSATMCAPREKKGRWRRSVASHRRRGRELRRRRQRRPMQGDVGGYQAKQAALVKDISPSRRGYTTALIPESGRRGITREMMSRRTAGSSIRR